MIKLSQITPPMYDISFSIAHHTPSVLLLALNMPYREFQFENQHHYHIFNRGINSQIIFSDDKEYQRALELISYYKFSSPKIKFSQLIRQPQEIKSNNLNRIITEAKCLVQVVAYCLMPSHFHLLLKQEQENGISKFLADFQNSYTRYFNTRNIKFGPILQGPFKAVLVETDNQLVHLSRYIHLNPYAAEIIKNRNDLEKYPWSSFPQYLYEVANSICNTQEVLSYFKDPSDYKQFVIDHADEQLEIKRIEHLIIDSD